MNKHVYKCLLENNRVFADSFTLMELSTATRQAALAGRLRQVVSGNTKGANKAEQAMGEYAEKQLKRGSHSKGAKPIAKQGRIEQAVKNIKAARGMKKTPKPSAFEGLHKAYQTGGIEGVIAHAKEKAGEWVGRAADTANKARAGIADAAKTHGPAYLAGMATSAPIAFGAGAKHAENKMWDAAKTYGPIAGGGLLAAHLLTRRARDDD